MKGNGNQVQQQNRNESRGQRAQRRGRGGH
jgi:hypothetical protein